MVVSQAIYDDVKLIVAYKKAYDAAKDKKDNNAMANNSAYAKIVYNRLPSDIKVKLQSSSTAQAQVFFGTLLIENLPLGRQPRNIGKPPAVSGVGVTGGKGAAGTGSFSRSIDTNLNLLPLLKAVETQVSRINTAIKRYK